MMRQFNNLTRPGNDGLSSDLFTDSRCMAAFSVGFNKRILQVKKLKLYNDRVMYSYSSITYTAFREAKVCAIATATEVISSIYVP